MASAEQAGGVAHSSLYFAETAFVAQEAGPGGEFQRMAEEEWKWGQVESLRLLRRWW